MDYSQFLVMKQEICLLVLFLLVFLGDTFLPKKAQNAIGTITCVLFGVFTLCVGQQVIISVFVVANSMN